jgi:hypothetical protein
MAIRCVHKDEAARNDYYNYDCILYTKRLKGEKNSKYPQYKDHPCPFMDFAECKAWMEGEKYALFEKIWTKKYDPAFFYAARFIDFCRRIENIPHSDLWKFMRRSYPDGHNLKFIGYPNNTMTAMEKIIHKFELDTFSPKPYKDPPDDCCLNEYCGPSCDQYVVCPMVHHRKELLAYGIPKQIAQTRQYTKWRWHLAKAKSIENGKREGEYPSKEAGVMWRAKTIWFILRQINAQDFATESSIRRRGYVDMKGQGTLPVIVDKL